MTEDNDLIAAMIESGQGAITGRSRTWLNSQVAQALATASAEAEALRKEVEALRAERDNLASIVRGWHYLAVGPDEMGDYYTHKQLVKASEPYASPALRTLSDPQP